jgi:selenocysteine lyase/cysteine desulfurase
MRGYQDAAEARPDDFIRYQYPTLLDDAREAVAKILNAPTETVVFVPNATAGVNTVLRNLVFEEGDKILYSSTIYPGCHKTVEYITETTPAESICVEYIFPVEDDWLVNEFRKKIHETKAAGGKVKVAIFDTVVSMPGIRLPYERLIQVCKEEGVLSCVDAAHGIGHVALDLQTLDPDFFISNCHKWLHVPRGCAVFYVPVRNQHLIRSTLPTSHGFIPKSRPGLTIPTLLPVVGVKSAWVQNFEFVGTIDNTPYLCIPAAIEWRKSIGGEEKILEYNQGLAKAAAKRTAEILGTEVLDNSTQTLTNCCLTNTRLPLKYEDVEAVALRAGIAKADVGMAVRNWIAKLLVERYNTFLALMFYGGNWWVRWSGQVYLELSDFEWAAETLNEVCERVLKGEFANVPSKL